MWCLLDFSISQRIVQQENVLKKFYIEGMRMFFERAAGTPCLWPAEFFAGFDQQGVVLVEKLYIIRQVRFEQFPQLLIIGVRLDQFVPHGNSSGVSIHDENWPVQGIKQNRIGGFTPNAFYRQKLLSQPAGFNGFKV